MQGPTVYRIKRTACTLGLYSINLYGTQLYSLVNQTETCIYIFSDMMIACVKFHWLDAGRVDYRPVTLHCRYKVQLSQFTCIIVVIYHLR